MPRFSSSRSTISGINPNAMSIDFDFGCVLGYIANQYRTLMKAIQEAAQNALDAKPRRVNLNINMKTGRVIIHDDGVGATRSRMRKCLKNIGKTLKGPDKLGQFGIGVVASYGKCRRFTFTTQPADKSESAFRLIFNCKDLGSATSSTEVPCVGANIDDQWWNSQLEVEGINSKAQLSKVDLDTLCDGLYKSFALALKKHKATITVRLTTAKGEQLPERSLSWIPFKGSRHDIESYTGRYGTTTFRMFTVQPDSRGKRKGQGVRVIDSTKIFSKELTCKIFPNGDGGASLLSKATCAAVTGGIFEGEIQLGASVQLDSSRNFFEESDAGVEAALHIESWLGEHGQSIISSIEDEESAERYRELADRALVSTEALLREDKELASLLRKEFTWGSQGGGHSKNAAKKGGPINGKRVQTPKGKNGNKPKSPPGKKKKTKPANKKNDSPLVVDGPDGAPRTEVMHDSTGLRIHLAGGGGDLWDLNKSHGVLTMNIAHETWVNLDTDNVSTSTRVRNELLCQLQKRIIQAVLGVLKTSVTWGYGEDDYDMLMNHMHEDTVRFGWSLLNDNKAAKAARNRAAKAARISDAYRKPR